MKKNDHGKLSSPRVNNRGFGKFARASARWTGRSGAFFLAIVCILIWIVTGPIFHFSDTWQLVINTATTIITFLMVFLIQNTQNRDSAVLHLKLDELIRVTESARNRLLDLEDLTEEDLKRLKGSFARLADTTDDAHLQKAANELDLASEGIQEAKQNVAAAIGKS